MEIKGKIICVLPLRSGTSRTSGSQWSSQEYVLETMEAYPKRVCFEVFGERVQRFAIKEGEILTVAFDIDAREYNGRWYNSIKAWNIQRQQEQQSSPYGIPQNIPTFGQPPYQQIPNGGYTQKPQPASVQAAPAQESDNDLPF